MTFQPFLISNYATGLDKSKEPWLTPMDSQHELFDGYVYRGVWEKRQGYNYYAIGERGGTSYVESRIVSHVTNEVVATGTGTDTYNLTFSQSPLARGSITITAGAQVATDNGLGQFIGAVNPVPSGSIDYTNGTATITFAAVVAGGEITASYNFHPGNPVMMIANYYTANNIRELIVADTQFVNRYNSTTNRLDDISQTATITGITQANPAVVTTSAAHGFVTGDRIFITGVRGMTQINNTPGTPYTITVTGATTFSLNGIDSSAFGAYVSGGITHRLFTGDNSNFFTWTNYPDASDNPRLLFCNNEDTIKVYDGSTVSDYTYNIDGGITTLVCLLMFQFKDRLVLLRTTENGTISPHRIRVSGTAAAADDFRTSATGAGVIDVPDETWINGAAFNRDFLVIFTEASTWLLNFTGNDVVPFSLKKLAEARGSGAPFSTITYLNRTTAASPRGLIITDGYEVERMDNHIPDYSYNEIDPDNFALCFAGAVDEDRDHYLIHPQPNEDASSRILVTNYEEDNFAVYRIPLSCMGNYIEAFDVTWNDLNIYTNWDALGVRYRNWNSFGYTRGTPIALGGGHNGEIWRLNVEDFEDNPQRIRAITYPDAANTPNLIDVETDFNNYQVGDYIFFAGNSGLTDINNKQYPIISIQTANRVFRVDKMTLTTDVWTNATIGIATRVIPFESKTKQFNPFAENAQKIQCGWLYFYISTSDNFLTDIDGNPEPTKIIVEIYTNDNNQPTQVGAFSTSPYESNASNLTNEIGSKKWNKIWINQTARFIQFKVRNTQAGAKIRIHAMMPGFAGVGRLI